MQFVMRFGAILCLCLFAPVPAFAEPRCLSLDELTAYVRTAAPAVELRHVEAEDAKAFVASYNAAPPVSGIEADMVLLATLPGNGVVRIVFFRAGCVAATGRIPAPLARRFLEEAQRGKV
jgi:hypothetical protein